MTLQNVSIVLSPTMQISHRLLYCFFEFSSSLFGSVVLKKYVPPISGPTGLLPESPEGIEEEMKKQESLLEALHKEISLGVASKATEEQLWEQQRIVTQLKRNLRHALAKVSTTSEPKRPEFDEELNFSLQTPQVFQEPEQPVANGGDGKEEGSSAAMQQAEVARAKTVGNEDQDRKAGLSSPEAESSAGSSSQEHRVTVQIHQAPSAHHQAPDTPGHVTVIQLSQQSPRTDHVDSYVGESKEEKSVAKEEVSRPAVVDSSHVAPTTFATPPVAAATEEGSPTSQGGVPSSSKVPVFLPLKTSTPGNSATANLTTKPPLAGFPLLPPPPHSSKGPMRPLPPFSGPPKGFNVPAEAKIKSKSLPRGLPSDGSIFDKYRDRKKDMLPGAGGNVVSAPGRAEEDREELLLEEMRLRFEYEELLNLKSELERRKKTERREVAELQVSKCG